MNKQKWIILLVALAMIGGAAVTLNRLKGNQRLGLPGIKTKLIANSSRLDVYLPEQVLNFDSVSVPTDTNILNGLPHDTSFMQRRYTSRDGGLFLLNIVLMGSDRTSMHNPEFCLPGGGWNIDRAESKYDVVPMQRPYAYNLPVSKLMTTREFDSGGQKETLRGVYVYWFATDKELAGTRNEMLWKAAAHLLKTGELQRWAFIFCFSACRPGDEGATYERMKKFLAAAVPEFQLVPGPRNDGQTLSQAASR
jgi:Protein of unknown function (DUF3485)